MDVFVARQPIFDRNRDIYAYELLFRSGETNAFPNIDGETATSSLLSSSFFTVGIEQICGGSLAFVNFPQKLVEQGTAEFFPPEKMAVEILEDTKVTPRIIKKCKELKKLGFKIALDDFIYQEEMGDLLGIVDIVKIDFRLDFPDNLPDVLDKLSSHKVQLLAEKVETYEEFERAKELGFKYFQGYFFSKPEILKNKELVSSQLNMLRLLNSINKEELDFDLLEEIISREISIAYKLLKYINSIRFARRQPISNIRQAIAFLGEREVKLFITLIATTNLSCDKPRELANVAIIRARFLQKLGEACGKNSKELFLLGLFSLIDAMLDQKMETLVARLPLSQELCTALISRKGELGLFLLLAENYEHDDSWEQFCTAREELQIDDELIGKVYTEAVGWANDFSACL